ncbi:cysteine desulfurase family protein, partial [Streptomyces sparsus]
MAYLDHAATTPMLPEAVREMTAQLAVTGNASSLHAAGRRARRTVEEARERLAASLGARPSEVVFTAGGTESDNLAVKGLYWARRAADPARTRVLASPVEHHAVLDAVHWLADHEGARVEWLPVDGHGRVHAGSLRAAVERDPDDIALISVMWANNEIGTLQPVAELARIAGEFDIPMHSDAVQAVGQAAVDFAASGLAAMTVSGHKIGGPYGIGALLLGRDQSPVPLLHGGGQERDVRSGTLDVPAVAAFAVAAEHAAARQERFAKEVGALRDLLVAEVRAAVPDAVLGGDPDPDGRLPANAHFAFPGCEGDSLLLLLDAQGIECSTGSACTAGVAQPSHVVLATGADPDLARGTLRFSLGHTSTRADVAAVAAAIGPAVE